MQNTMRNNSWDVEFNNDRNRSRTVEYIKYPDKIDISVCSLYLSSTFGKSSNSTLVHRDKHFELAGKYLNINLKSFLSI